MAVVLRVPTATLPSQKWRMPCGPQYGVKSETAPYRCGCGTWSHRRRA
jgi:hypothetical protein